MSFALRLSQTTKLAERLCVGVDPHPSTLVDWGVNDSVEGLRTFSMALLDSMVEAGIAFTKPQVALFERHGVEGMQVLAHFIHEARTRGLMVIADVKRGDIGSSLAGYAHAWLGKGSDFEADAMTTVAYQGVGTLEAAFQQAADGGKAVFVLAATSNPEGHILQSALTAGGIPVAAEIANAVTERVTHHPHSEPGWLGVVVGATVNRVSVGLSAENLEGLSLLAPGFGAQGVALNTAPQLFEGLTKRLIPTVSRSVAGDGRDGLVDRIRAHLSELAV